VALNWLFPYLRITPFELIPKPGFPFSHAKLAGAKTLTAEAQAQMAERAPEPVAAAGEAGEGGGDMSAFDMEASMAAAAAAAGIDPTFLDALPPEMRNEVLATQLEAQRHTAAAGSSTSPPSPPPPPSLVSGESLKAETKTQRGGDKFPHAAKPTRTRTHQHKCTHIGKSTR
jgi:hypothetical protein